MRILLLHPEDSPRFGPWTRQKWDLIIDLGKSSESTAAAWQVLTGSSVLRLESFRRSVEDPREAGNILRSGDGRVLDKLGLDWWALTSLFIHAEVETALLLFRLAASGSLSGELYATRADWPVSGVGQLVGKQVPTFGDRDDNGVVHRLSHYAGLLRKLKLAQIAEIFFDKYDAGHAWRSRVALRPKPAAKPVVLLPSAYTNVSRMAAAYARILPDQLFRLVATRRSGRQFDRPPNVQVADLAAYAGGQPSRAEYIDILRNWAELRGQLAKIPALELLSCLGVLDRFAKWFQDGLAVREAWQRVLDQEPVTAVLCGDDSNWYTRLPVLLARKRGLPTVDFHHGAFDGRFLLKKLSSDLYLAKGQMERDYLLQICSLPAERVKVGAPHRASPVRRVENDRGGRPSIVFFSEPYESSGGRPGEIYRDLLPVLCRLAVEHGRTVVVKLHPFENPKERSRLVDTILSSEQRFLVKVVGSPLSDELLASAWFGITVESTTVVDCTQHSVPCFLCEWLVASPYGYVQQYARFGVGRLLHSASEISDIPRILHEAELRTEQHGAIEQPIEAEMFRSLLAGRFAPVAN